MGKNTLVPIFLGLILVLSALAVTTTAPAAAQDEKRIKLSQTSLSDNVIIEIKVYTVDDVGASIPLRVYDKTTGAAASLQDFQAPANTIDFTTKKFVATKYTTGVYVAYLAGNSVTSDPMYPKVTIDKDASDGAANYVKFSAGVDDKTYVIEWAGTGITNEIDYTWVAPDSITMDRDEYPKDDASARLYIIDRDYNSDPTKIDTVSSNNINVVSAKVTRAGASYSWTGTASLTAVLYAGTATNGAETSVNDAKIKFEFAMNNLENWLIANAGLDQFKDGDLVELGLQGTSKICGITSISLCLSWGVRR
jgi:hypothetical protein